MEMKWVTELHAWGRRNRGEWLTFCSVFFYCLFPFLSRKDLLDQKVYEARNSLECGLFSLPWTIFYCIPKQHPIFWESGLSLGIERLSLLILSQLSSSSFLPTLEMGFGECYNRKWGFFYLGFFGLAFWTLNPTGQMLLCRASSCEHFGSV